MKYDSLVYPYPSQRMCAYAKNGMVATSQPLAAQIGLQILQKGGNAIDAAIATAAALTVLEPTSNGIGGDAFALIWFNKELHGLNASGPAPRGLTIEKVHQLGYEEMPTYGWLPVTVPGTPSAWATLSKRFGRLPFKELLQPAIEYAENGYPISPILGKYWRIGFKRMKEDLKGEEFKHWFEMFTIDGRAPGIGEIWSSPPLAETLAEIAQTKGESFYRGQLAKKIAGYARKTNGFITEEDLGEYHPQWVKPIKIDYRDHQIWEIPPNGQGLNTLMALNILKGFDFTTRDTPETFHHQIEAMKLAFTDGLHYITDPEYMKADVELLLSEEFAKSRRELISGQALTPAPGTLPDGGTVYLATADHEGNMVSYIQSNYYDFGSGIVVPETGIALQNRGKEFSLDKKHPNALAPGKKTYHTIIPGFITKDKTPVGPFGVMGAYMQPQGHLQVVMNLLDFALNPQAALDAPRWMWHQGKTVLVEPHFPSHLAQKLARKGHQITKTVDEHGFGRGQIIFRDPKSGVLIGGTDPRTDSQIACY